MGMNQRRILFWPGLAIASAVIVWSLWTLRGHWAGSRELPPVSTGPWLNTGPQTAYVGTSACVACHPAEHESYVMTLHSRSLNEVSAPREPPDGEFSVPETSRVYSVYREGEELRHRQSLRTAVGSEFVLADHPLRYVVGSGHLSRTYLVEADGYLVESPITWYAASEKWWLSPGYEQHDSGFARPVYFECLNCHAGRVTAASDSDGRLAVAETAIGCERCHGPGELHVQSRSAGTKLEGTIDRTIVNPEHLDRDRREAVCAQCHLDGKAAVELSGRKARDYRPGLLWTDFRIDYGVQSARGSMAVVGHVEQMRASRCYQASATLTCTTCHDPHSHLAADKRAEHYRETCLACHTARDCRIGENERRTTTAVDDCTICHMPQTSTDVPHVAATHHRIGIHSAAREADESLEAGELKAVWHPRPLPALEDQRDRGLAYLQLSLKESVPERSEKYRRRARDLLQGALSGLPQDAEVLAALAQIHIVDHPARAVEFGKRALAHDDLPPRAKARALFGISEAYFQQRATGKAEPYLEQLVTIRRQGADWYHLALCRYRSGNIAAAVEAAAAAADIMPEYPNLQELLAELAGRQGDPERSAIHRQRARTLRSALGGGEHVEMSLPDR